jgi:hypothetical protein
MGNQHSQDDADDIPLHHQQIQARRQASQNTSSNDTMLSQLQNKLSNLGISPQEIQAKVADKLNLKKSKSTPAQGS